MLCFWNLNLILCYFPSTLQWKKVLTICMQAFVWMLGMHLIYLVYTCLHGRAQCCELDSILGTLGSTTTARLNVKKQCKFKLLREVTVHIDYHIWYFKLVLWPPRCSSSAKTIVVTELKSTLRNSSHLSASSRCSEDMIMLRVALFTERGMMSRILLGLQIIHFLCFSLMEVGNEIVIHFLLSFISNLNIMPLFMFIEANAVYKSL